MSRAPTSFEAWCRRWLEKHPEEDPTLRRVAETIATRPERKAAAEEQALQDFSVELAAFGVAGLELDAEGRAVRALGFDEAVALQERFAAAEPARPVLPAAVLERCEVAGMTPPDAVYVDPERPHAFACFQTPAAACEAQARCTSCPAYADWRAKVRPPYEVSR